MTVSKNDATEIAIIGAGIAGIAVGNFLATKFGVRDVILIDLGRPMGFTSAQSGENYRNWWPHPVMRQFTDRSIDLMEEIAVACGASLNMTRRGYALATRQENSDALIEQLYASYEDCPDRLIRIHKGRKTPDYVPAGQGPWHEAPNGIDVLQGGDLISGIFSGFDKSVKTVIHIRRGGDISSQQLGQFLLERFRASGGRLLQGRVRELSAASPFSLKIETSEGTRTLSAERIVIAAGPFVQQITGMLGITLPVINVVQQKIAFADGAGAIPRDLPFTVDLDEQRIDWDADERNVLSEMAHTTWLTEPMPGGLHCRPDGGKNGTWIKLGWAYNKFVSEPSWDPPLDPHFPEIILRGAARLHPALKAYYGRLPRQMTHYGGYYTMTEENWPLIGGLGVDCAYVVTALSGFGTMAACAAGELCASWVCDATRPAYANALSLDRYNDSRLMHELHACADKGLL